MKGRGEWMMISTEKNRKKSEKIKKQQKKNKNLRYCINNFSKYSIEMG
jgi:hypothetical protein